MEYPYILLTQLANSSSVTLTGGLITIDPSVEMVPGRVATGFGRD